MRASPKVEVDQDMVLGKATKRAAALLGLNGRALSEVIGFSEPTVSRIISGDRGISPKSKEGQLALLLVRVFRSLSALVGDDNSKLKLWMNSRNNALNGVPAELIKNAEGLVRSLAYLDGMRAPN